MPLRNHLGRAKLIRISLTFFYTLGSKLKPLLNIVPETSLGEVWNTLYDAQSEVQALLETDWFTPAVRTAQPAGTRLFNALKAITDRSDFGENLTYIDVFNIQDALKEFETTLCAALYVADTYFVSAKAAYDTTTLITNPEKMFPSELITKIPKVIPEIREAGKCLAFELSTAAGFHILRATETVVREYWTAVSNGKPHPYTKTIGKYAHAMEKNRIGKKKVIETLKQIADLHRNPLMHPDDTLNNEDAIHLLGICISAITVMLKEIP